LDVAQELVTKAGAASVTGPHGPLSVGLSVGITTIQSNDDADIDELLRQADSACYEAKRSGGGFAVFDKRLPTITKT
jgi:GGDEF domain-containing protein